MLLTGVQIRAARGMLRWSVRETALRAGISEPTVKRFEQVDGIPPGRAQSHLDLQRAFEGAGIDFTGTPDEGPGVRWRGPVG